MGSLLNMSGGSLLNKRILYDSQIQYLKSDGAAYIDTGVYATSSLQCDIEFAIESGFDFGNKWLFGAFTQNDSMCRYYIRMYSTTNVYIASGNKSNSVRCGTFGTSKHTFSYKSGMFLYDGVEKATSSAVTNSNELSIWLFAANAPEYNFEIADKLRIYAITMSDGNNIVRDFIPVRVGTTGYLYDKVSGRLFGNAAGSGSLILGPDNTN